MRFFCPLLAEFGIVKESTSFGQNISKYFFLRFFFRAIEHGPVDDEAVVPGAAADDQAEHKQCKFLLSAIFGLRSFLQSNIRDFRCVQCASGLNSRCFLQQELYSLLENIAKATIEVFQKSAEMNSNNPSGNGAAAQGGSASNSSSTANKMKPILRCHAVCACYSCTCSHSSRS